MRVAWIGLAGIVGTCHRHVLGLWAHASFPQTSFPVGTLAVNLIGCFALGWFSHRIAGKFRIPEQARAAVSTGLIGSFTTFSAFSVETVELIRDGMIGAGLAYAGTSLFGGLLFVWLGSAAGKGGIRATGEDGRAVPLDGGGNGR